MADRLADGSLALKATSQVLNHPSMIRQAQKVLVFSSTPSISGERTTTIMASPIFF